MDKKILTEEGLGEIKKELNHLLNIERPKVIIELKEARAQGDLSENADYDAARDNQAKIESKIKKFQIILDNYKIIEKSNFKKDHKDHAWIGDEVEIENLEIKKTFKYKIVGSIEADPFANKISNESPLAKAILSKKVGDSVYVYPDELNGSYQVKILNIFKK